jgi:hypothetical protein
MYVILVSDLGAHPESLTEVTRDPGRGQDDD